jgi:membrane-associated phospholipid phosphatase
MCLALLVIFNAPRILVACFVALVIWAPIQLLINRYVTKISTHAGVVAACSTGLLLAGKLNHPILLALMIVIAVVTLWARVETKNHTVPQVLLGFLVGALAVLVVFPLMLILI